MRFTALTHVILSALLLATMVAAYGAWHAYVDSITRDAAAMREELVSAQPTAAAGGEGSERVRGYFVPTAGVVPFLASLAKEGARLGSSVEVVSVSQSSEAGDGIVASLTIAGSFDSVMRTLGYIEYAPYDSAFERVSLDAVSSGEAGQWVARVTMRIGTIAPDA